jgi:hypothetical protein
MNKEEYKKLFDSFWLPYFDYVGYMMYHYVACVLNRVNAVNDAFNTLLEANNYIVAASMVRNQIDNLIFLYKAVAADDKQKYLQGFFQNKEDNSSQRKYVKRLSSKYEDLQNYWDMFSNYIHPRYETTGEAIKSNKNAFFITKNTIDFNLDNPAVLAYANVEDLKDGMSYINSIICDLLKELKKMQPKPDPTELEGEYKNVYMNYQLYNIKHIDLVRFPSGLKIITNKYNMNPKLKEKLINLEK